MNSNHNVFCATVDVAIHDIDRSIIKDSGLKLYTIKLSSYYHLIDDFILLLLPHEIQRAERYHALKDKNRFIICRTLLKFILAAKTELEVSDIHFEKDSNKKPYLPSHRSICFNVSHSEDYAIIAISDDEIGVDVEYINKNFEYSDILNHVFSDIEIETVLNSQNKKKIFYSFWTRKEAFVKATGKGITNQLPEIPSIEGHHNIFPDLLVDFQNLNVLGFDLDRDYVAAIAFGGACLNVNMISIYTLPTSMDALVLLLNK